MTKNVLPKLTLVLGGANSGKSVAAENLVLSRDYTPTYIATAQAFDAEMQQKIDLHKARRDSRWENWEEPLALSEAVLDLGADQCALIDCVTLWLSNHLLAGSDLDANQSSLIAALGRAECPIVVVSNEVGLSVVPESKLGRQFRAAQGRLNQALAAEADEVLFVTAGLVQVLKSP